MKYEDVKIDERYLVNYIDPDYPCKCPCHDFPDRYKHVGPCCYDTSYNGLATCTKKDDKTKLITLMIDEKIGGGWYLCIFAEDILDKLQK